MPGVASLEANRYYAFPRNAFWKIMAELFAGSEPLDYHSGTQMLFENRIALWDVINSCQRQGSLDSAISSDGLVTNDFNGFFDQHPEIGHVYFNGQKAAALYKKKVLPELKHDYEYQILPSTSPANAASSYTVKLEAWAIICRDDPARTQFPEC